MDRKKLIGKLRCSMALAALIAAPVQVGAAPLYLLFEGTITSSLDENYCGFPPFCVIEDARAGQSFKIEAVWDDAKFFGDDVDTAANKGHYGGTGQYGEIYSNGDYQPGNTYHLLSGQQIDELTPRPPYFKLTVNGHSHDSYLSQIDYDRLGGWTLDLKTERDSNGDRVSFDLIVDGDSYLFQSGRTFSFDLHTPAQTLDDALFGFVWDASQGGSATGQDYTYYVRHGWPFYTTDQITWSRLVMSYDPNDLAPVPVPAAFWLFGSGVLALAGGRIRRSAQ